MSFVWISTIVEFDLHEVCSLLASFREVNGIFILWFRSLIFFRLMTFLLIIEGCYRAQLHELIIGKVFTIINAYVRSGVNCD